MLTLAKHPAKSFLACRRHADFHDLDLLVEKIINSMEIITNDKKKRIYYKLEMIGPQTMKYSFIAQHTFFEKFLFFFFFSRRRNDFLRTRKNLEEMVTKDDEKVIKSCSGALMNEHEDLSHPLTVSTF